MLPPPAPTELTATIGIAVARPKTSARTRRSGSPRWITATSKLVPPMSAVMTSPRSAASASARAADTPATGPDCASTTGRARASAGPKVPPLDCITATGTRSPAAVNRPSTASKNAEPARDV